LATCAKSGPIRGGRDSGRFALSPPDILCFCEERSSHGHVKNQGLAERRLNGNLAVVRDETRAVTSEADSAVETKLVPIVGFVNLRLGSCKTLAVEAHEGRGHEELPDVYAVSSGLSDGAGVKQ